MSGEIVQWNGGNRPTTFVSSTELQAQITQADVSASGNASVTMVNPGGGANGANAATFTINMYTVLYPSGRAQDGSGAATNGVQNIWKMNPDGSNQVPLTNFTSALPNDSSISAAWSPDGTRIAFESWGALNGSNVMSGALNMWVMNADGSAKTALTKMTAANMIVGWEAWSPDGTKIAYISYRALDGSDAIIPNQNLNLWVMNADGTGTTPLTHYDVAASPSGPNVIAGPTGVRWSPDGTKILFASTGALDGSDALNANGDENVWVVNPDGSGRTPLTAYSGGSTSGAPLAYSALWMPDGKRIAFVSDGALDGSNASNTNGAFNIWFMNLDGSSKSPLTQSTSAASTGFVVFQLSPDGTKFLYQSGRINLWTINIDGTGATQLMQYTNTSILMGLAIYSPSGSQIFFFSTADLSGQDAPNQFTNSMGVLTPVSNVWVVNADGSGRMPLTKFDADGTSSFAPMVP